MTTFCLLQKCFRITVWMRRILRLLENTRVSVSAKRRYNFDTMVASQLYKLLYCCCEVQAKHRRKKYEQFCPHRRPLASKSLELSISISIYSYTKRLQNATKKHGKTEITTKLQIILIVNMRLCTTCNLGSSAGMNYHNNYCITFHTELAPNVGAGTISHLIRCGGGAHVLLPLH